jgi:hypothetical protein
VRAAFRFVKLEDDVSGMKDVTPPQVEWNRPGAFARCNRLVRLATGEPSGIGGDPDAVELSLQEAVRVDPQRQPSDSTAG